MNLSRSLKLATRKSKLAIAQSEWVASELERLHDGVRVELVTFDTQGDQILDKNLAEIGGKGLFTYELEQALMQGTVDFAVHSLKDMPALLPNGLAITCVPEREDPADVFISHKYSSLAELPAGAVIGTSSTRRAAQAKALHPDVQIMPFRGNVQTRLKKLQDGQVDATFLAMAGLNRLNMSAVATEVVSTAAMIPAVGQGALAIEAREDNEAINHLLAPLHHLKTAIAVDAERAFLQALDGSCKTPLAAHAMVDGDKLTLNAMVAAIDGSVAFHCSVDGKVADAKKLGIQAAEQLKKQAGNDVIQGWRT